MADWSYDKALVQDCARGGEVLVLLLLLLHISRPSCHARSAVLVDAVQKVGMRYRPGRQLWAAAVLLSTHGLELTLLKNYLDDGGDYHTCYKLCYNALQVGGGAARLGEGDV